MTADEDQLALMERRMENLARERDHASAMRIRGAKLLLLLPLNFMIVLAGLAIFGGHTIVSVLFVIACMFAVIGGISGLVMVAIGTAQKRVASERLTELAESRRLPEARLVVR